MKKRTSFSLDENNIKFLSKTQARLILAKGKSVSQSEIVDKLIKMLAEGKTKYSSLEAEIQ